MKEQKTKRTTNLTMRLMSLLLVCVFLLGLLPTAAFATDDVVGSTEPEAVQTETTEVPEGENEIQNEESTEPAETANDAVDADSEEETVDEEDPEPVDVISADGETITADYSWYTGAASDATEYTISSAGAFLGFLNLLGYQDAANSGQNAVVDFDGKTVKLTCDVDMDGYTCADTNVYFNGTFEGAKADGTKAKISNLNFVRNYWSVGTGKTSVWKNLSFENCTAKRSGVVWFLACTTCENCEFKNITVEATSTSSYNIFVLMADTVEGCTVTNCKVNANSTTSSGWSTIIIGSNANTSKIENTTVSGCTVNSPSYAALIRNASVEGQSNVENCSVTSTNGNAAFLALCDASDSTFTGNSVTASGWAEFARKKTST